MLVAALSLDPDTVLDKYKAALEAAKPPAAYSFEYAIEDRGKRSLDRTHRVYRTAQSERDEILSVDGQRLTRAQVRIFARRRDRYAIATIAPSPAAYAFTYVGPVKNGRHYDYVFDAVPRRTSAFAVTRMVVDGNLFLPRKIAFSTHAGGIAGEGTIAYNKADRYWMPVSASASAVVAGTTQTERIVWSRYRFFSSLPPSTFSLPRPLPTPVISTIQ